MLLWVSLVLQPHIACPHPVLLQELGMCFAHIAWLACILTSPHMNLSSYIAQMCVAPGMSLKSDPVLKKLVC